MAKRPHALDLPESTGPVRCGEVEAHCRAIGLWPLMGTDEVGRGPLAGPVVAAAVILRDDADLPGLNDSKLLTHARREALVPRIQQAALAFAIIEADEARIDRMNILGASLWAMHEAAEDVCRQLVALGLPLPAALLVDGHMQVPGFSLIVQRTVIKGDARSLCIAAASVLAKVHRDAHMTQLDTQFPGYGLAIHKGYPTPMHLEALERLGPTPIHRRSFGPVARLCAAAAPVTPGLPLR